MSDVYLPNFLRMRCVYWPPARPDKFGAMHYGDPVELKCRWDEKILEFIDTQKVKQVSQALVLVDQDLAAGGMLWLGTLAAAPPIPTPTAGAYVVKQFQKTPNVNCTKFVRTAIL